MTVGTAINVRRDCQCARARHVHGTYLAYQADRCRCEECRKAWVRAQTRYKAGLRSVSLAGQSGTVNPAGTLAWLASLNAAGYSNERVARAIGVSHHAVGDLVAGRRRRPTRRTAAKIAALGRSMGLRPAKTAAVPNRDIDATGTTRRVRGLMAAGWSTARIAEAAGVTQNTAYTLTTGRTGTTVRTATRVRAATRVLLGKVPPDDAATKRARAYAARMGFLPLAAWADGDLDNPEAVPLPLAVWDPSERGRTARRREARRAGREAVAA